MAPETEAAELAAGQSQRDYRAPPRLALDRLVATPLVLDQID